MNTRKKRKISIEIGCNYPTTSYGNALVLDVKSYKEVLVKFLDTGNEQIVAGGSLIIGQVVDKKLFDETKLLFAGKVCSTKSYGFVEVIDIDNQKCTVKFLNTGNVQVVEAGNLRRGLIKDNAYVEEVCKYKIGSTHKTKSSGDVEVIEIINSHNIVVKFVNTGNTSTVSGGNLLKGNVCDVVSFEDNYPYKVGYVFKSNNYGDFTILELLGGKKHRVVVRFTDTGSIVKTTISQIAYGTVKDPNSNVFTPKELGVNRFCVYLHKDDNGVVRYVGQGLVKRAFTVLGRNRKWNELFRDKYPIVEYVKSDISKEEAEDLEQEMIAKYSDTIVNQVKTYSRTREMKYEDFSPYFYISEDSVSGLKWKVAYNKHNPGEDASDSTPKEYHIVYVNGANHLVHRIVWLLANGEISKDMIVDHKNRKRGDNRLQNLSLVNMSHNMRNRTLPLPNSGYRNISMNVSNTGIFRFTVNYTKPLHDSRDKISFSTVTYRNPFEAFLAAYSYRDTLISDGVLLDVIKEGEKPIKDMEDYLISLTKEVS